MCEEISDTDIELMFKHMTEEEINEFWSELERVSKFVDLLKKGYSFSGGEFSKTIFVYKK